MKVSIIALCGIFFAGNAFSAGTHIYPVPDCPNGLTIQIYTFHPASKKMPENLPNLKGDKSIRDAGTYFGSVGIKLAKGGYAYYFPERHLLIVATNREGHDALSMLLD